MSKRSKCILQLILLLLPFYSFAGKRDTIAYVTVAYLRNNLAYNTSRVMSYDDFFQNRMTSPKNLTKGDKAPCKVLFETDKYVYYGNPYYLYFKDSNNYYQKGELFVYKYYKTDRNILKSIFPKYDSIEGYQIREIIDKKYIDPVERITFQNMGGFSKCNFNYTLTDTSIEVDTRYVANAGNWLYFTRRFIWHTVFDKNTLKIIRNDTLQYGRKKT